MEKQQYPSVSFFGKESFIPVLFSDNTFIFDWEISAGHIVPEHIHPNVEEQFDVTSGEMTFKLNGRVIVAKAGETVIIPKGLPHEVKNATKETASCRVSYTPARDQGKFFDIALFLLNENPALNGKMSMVFKMIYVSKQMKFEDFSSPASTGGMIFFATLWAPVKLWGDIAGWGKITNKYKAYKSLINA